MHPVELAAYNSGVNSGIFGTIIAVAIAGLVFALGRLSSKMDEKRAIQLAEETKVGLAKIKAVEEENKNLQKDLLQFSRMLENCEKEKALLQDGIKS